MVQAFRRAQSLYETARFKLRGLDADTRYTLANLEAPWAAYATGKELMEQGLLMAIADRPAP